MKVQVGSVHARYAKWNSIVVSTLWNCLIWVYWMMHIESLADRCRHYVHSRICKTLFVVTSLVCCCISALLWCCEVSYPLCVFSETSTHTSHSISCRLRGTLVLCSQHWSIRGNQRSGRKITPRWMSGTRKVLMRWRCHIDNELLL